MSMPASPRLRGALIAMSIAAVGALGCENHDPVARGQVSAFDTTLEITLIGVNRERANEVSDILQADMRQLESAWHAWKPGPVSRMNALFNAGGEPFAAPPSVLPLLRLSMQLEAQSEGLFNPAIGHLLRAWGFHGRPADCLQPPAADLIQQAVAARPSMQDIKIDGFRLSSKNHWVKLDFRGIQLGYAIDQAIARLQDLGINNASVSADGNLRAIGSRDGYPWSVAVHGPAGRGILATLEILGNEAAFTADPSGSSFTWEGETYHDIIDPRSGYPADGTTSVTVLHPSASTADAAATALFVAGPHDWHRVAKLMGVRYVMLTDNAGRIHMNPAMQARVKLKSLNREVIISQPLT
jgi:thiamine biosynthesis lipoprotein